MSHGHSNRVISPGDIHVPKGHTFHKLTKVILLVGFIALGASMAMGLTGDHKSDFYYGYLTSFIFWLTFPLGALAFILFQHMTRAGWSPVVRRIAEASVGTFPLFAILLIPIIFGIHELYEWSHLNADGMLLHPDGTLTPDPVLTHKASYLNEGAFTIRAIIYVVIWSVLGTFLWRKSVKADTASPEAAIKASHSLRQWSPIGLLLFALTISFAVMDWVMSIQPHWFSTIFGVYYFANAFIGSLSMMIVTGMLLQRMGFLKDIITIEHYHDLGKLLFGFIVFWAYIAFSQYFLIWYANIPEETLFYSMRYVGGWEYVSMFQIFGHFIIPFFFLMSRHIKRRRTTLLIGAVWMIMANYVDIFWLVQPMLGEHHGNPGVHVTLYDILCFIGLGGLSIGAFLTLLGRAALIPKADPRLAESLVFENF